MEKTDTAEIVFAKTILASAGGVVDIGNFPLIYVDHHAKFGCFCVILCACMQLPKFLGDLESWGWVVDDLEKHPTPLIFTATNSVTLGCIPKGCWLKMVPLILTKILSNNDSNSTKLPGSGS